MGKFLPLQNQELVNLTPCDRLLTILRAILAGERDPQQLATYRDKRCTHDQATIAKALTGHWRAEPLLALPQAVDQHDFLAQQ